MLYAMCYDMLWGMLCYVLWYAMKYELWYMLWNMLALCYDKIQAMVWLRNDYDSIVWDITKHVHQLIRIRTRYETMKVMMASKLACVVPTRVRSGWTMVWVGNGLAAPTTP